MAVIPSIWTSSAICVSLITASLLPMRQTLADGAAGVIQPSPEESHQFQGVTRENTTGRDPLSCQGTVSSTCTANSAHELPRTFTVKPAGGESQRSLGEEDTGSETGLTDAIWYSRQYRTEHDTD